MNYIIGMAGMAEGVEILSLFIFYCGLVSSLGLLVLSCVKRYKWSLILSVILCALLHLLCWPWLYLVEWDPAQCDRDGNVIIDPDVLYFYHAGQVAGKFYILYLVSYLIIVLFTMLRLKKLNGN